MHFVILETNVFPDGETLEKALATLAVAPMSHRLSHYDLRRADMTDADWDAVVGAIVACDMVVTV
ncbi:MAG TPA: hypothetical protein VMV40_05505 [Acidiferrobacter sp.]|nr:hypothetical protein [Acidiferrobacter sp.]